VESLIPEWLRSILTPRGTKDKQWDDHRYRATIKPLLRYGLVRPVNGPAGTKGLTMHGLVRWRAQQEADHDSYWKPYVVWMNLVVRHDALFTEARPYQWIIPHLPSTKALHDNFQIPPRPLLCAVLRVYAEVWKSARRWQRAERLFIKLFHIAKEMGDDDLKRIFRHELGEIQFHRKFQDEESARGSDIKRRTEAAILIEKIYASERLELGENDLMTLSTGTNLVGIYFRQGREAKAAELSAKLLESQTEALGATHPQTLMLRLHACSRGPAKAEIVANVKIQTGVLDLATEQLGKDHPVTISAMRHLASSHGKLERWPEAEELLFKVIGVQTAVLGQAHPDTLADMRKLAALYEARGSTAEAAELREKADALYREYLEPEDPEEEIRRYDLFDAQMGSPSEVKTERQDLTQHEQDDNEDIHRPPSPTFRGRSWQDGDRGTNYSGSSASEMARYTLDEFDDGPIIVYKYRGGIQTTTQKELCAALDKGELSFRCAITHSCIRY